LTASERFAELHDPEAKVIGQVHRHYSHRKNFLLRLQWQLLQPHHRVQDGVNTFLEVRIVRVFYNERWYGSIVFMIIFLMMMIYSAIGDELLIAFLDS
jgi:hypothetical protein